MSYSPVSFNKFESGLQHLLNSWANNCQFFIFHIAVFAEYAKKTTLGNQIMSPEWVRQIQHWRIANHNTVIRLKFIKQIWLSKPHGDLLLVGYCAIQQAF